MMMSGLDRHQILEDLAELGKCGAKIFGSDVHGFRLNLPLGEINVLAFEQAHGICLPEDYRSFLTVIGNGGAGPFYGVFPLGKFDGSGNSLVPWSEGDGFVGTLRLPFPLREAWNDLALLPAEELLATDETEYWKQIKRFEAAHWDSSRMNGAIPICHMGCALRVWLVVTGEQSGFLWRDGRTDDSGLSPLLLRDGSRAQFGSWYSEWLQDALASSKLKGK